MTRRNMEIFVAVVEYGKMSEAARRLYLTQSSVSQAIAEIEREYGVILFERLSRNLFLTDTGREIYAYCKQILNLQTEMEEYCVSGVRCAKLRIGATVTVGSCAISPIITRLKQQNPNLRAEVSVENTYLVEERLLDSSLDVGLVEGKIHHPNLLVEKVISDKLVVICPKGHPFYGRKTVSVAELASQSFLLREVGSGTRELFESEMKRRHTSIDILWNCYSTDAIVSGVLAGLGISVISRRLAENEVHNHLLGTCDIEGMDLSRTFDLVMHGNKHSTEALRLFARVCREYGKESSAL